MIWRFLFDAQQETRTLHPRDLGAVARRSWTLLLLGACLFRAFPCLAQQEPAPALVSAAGVVAANSSLEELEEQAFREALARVAPSIVRIETVGGLEQVEELLVGHGPTTGVVVSADGWIISSAFNFIAKPSTILVRLADGRPLPATLVASDRSRSLSLLKIDASGLTPVISAPKSETRIGQWAIACGLTLDPSVPNLSVGIVSALGRVWGRAIQTDAKVSPLNYGGPLIDIEGRAMGILVPLAPDSRSEVAGVEWYDGGIGFAIPLEDVLSLLPRLQAGVDLYPGLMGISFKDDGLSATSIVIDRVHFQSPADRAGLKAGDVIVASAGQPLMRVSQLRQLVGPKLAGDRLPLTVRRGEQTLEVTLDLVGQLEPYRQPWLGIVPERVATTSPVMAQAAPNEAAAGAEAPSQPASDGVRIRVVREDSPARAAGLVAGESIMSLNGVALAGATDLADRLSRLPQQEVVRLSVRPAPGAADMTPRDVEATLATIPDALPPEIGSELFEPQPGSIVTTGRRSVTVAGFDRDYWCYVPEVARSGRPLSLVVWLHPANDTMEAELLKVWRPLCEQRGIVLVAPEAERLAGWSPGDREFIEACVLDIGKQCTIDPRRVVLHANRGSALLAWLCALRNPATYRGVAIIGVAIPAQLPERDPETRQRFLVVAPAAPKSAEQATLKKTREAGYPLAEVIDASGSQYLSPEALAAMGRWIELLDEM